MESQFGKIHYEIPHFSVLNQDLLSLREKALVLRKYCDRASGNLDRSLFEVF